MNNGLYTGMLHMHSVGRWLVLILLLVAIFRSIAAGKNNFTHTDQRVGLFLMIFTDLMLLVGLYLYFAGPNGYNLVSGDMGAAMKNPVQRFYGIEHMLGMLVAIILIHVGKAQGKKDLPHAVKHRRTAIYYLLALLVILISIPWPFREVGSGRGWF